MHKHDLGQNISVLCIFSQNFKSLGLIQVLKKDLSKTFHNLFQSELSLGI